MPYNSCIMRGGPPFPDSFETPGAHPLIPVELREEIVGRAKKQMAVLQMFKRRRPAQGAMRPSSAGKSKGRRTR